MRIAVVETSAFGGLLHYAVQLADGLARRSNDVDLIVPRGNELRGHAGEARMHAVLAPPSGPGDARPKAPARRFFKRAGVAMRLLSAWLRTLREVRAGRYDAVIVNSDTYVSIAAAGALALTYFKGGARIAAISHNARSLEEETQTANGRGSPMARLLRLLNSRYDLIFVHGESSQAEFAATWPHRAIASIPHGDERVFASSPPEPATEERVLLFGDWNWAKGIPVLMEAFDAVRERLPSAKLTLAGMPDPTQIDVEAIRIWARGHKGAVELREGYVPMDEVPALFGRARVVATPYIAGYQSGVVHLAMTMARPVVATTIGDLPSVVLDGINGFVVPPQDPQALAEALVRVLADPDLSARLGQAGWKAMQDGSSWENVAERVEGALARLGAEASMEEQRHE